MTPLQERIALALETDIRNQLNVIHHPSGSAPPHPADVLSYKHLAQVVYDTIRAAMAEALLGVHRARLAREAEVNKAIDEVTEL